MSNSPQNKPTGTEAPNSKVQFTTKNIGSWKRKQENPFAEQNRKNQAQKNKRNQKREKATPFVVILGSAAVIGVALWGLAMLIVSLLNNNGITAPTIAGGSMEDIANYSEILQNFFNQHTGTPAEQFADVNKLVEDSLKTSNGKKYANEIKLAQGNFYFDNEMYYEAIDILESINVEGFDIYQNIYYNNTLYYIYTALGQYDTANEYFQTASDLRAELRKNEPVMETEQ